jgi:hypothetical protein
MRSLLIVVVASAASACGSSGTVDDSPDARTSAIDAAASDSSGGSSVDAAAPDARVGDGCAMAPTGDWAGVASGYTGGAGGGETVTAHVQWSLVSSDACIDHFAPSGAVEYDPATQCNLIVEPSMGPIEPGDGELILDRSTATATARLVGVSRFPAIVYCEGDPPPQETHPVGGRWADVTGSFDGAVIGGSTNFYGDFHMRWDLRRTDTVFSPPDDGACSEPSSQHWTSRAHWDDRVASVTWTRVSTDGCVDRYTPSGTIEALPWTSTECAYTYDPSSAAIVADELDVLVIDRSTDPATFDINGTSFFETTRICTRPDGTTTEDPGILVGGVWVNAEGPFDGDHLSAAWDVDGRADSWRLDRID